MSTDHPILEKKSANKNFEFFFSKILSADFGLLADLIKFILTTKNVVELETTTSHQNIAVRKMSRSKQLYFFNQVYPYIPFHVEFKAKPNNSI
jgi:hypothetical protein